MKTKNWLIYTKPLYFFINSKSNQSHKVPKAANVTFWRPTKEWTTKISFLSFFLVISVEKEILDKDPSQPTQPEATHLVPVVDYIRWWSVCFGKAR